MTPAAGWGDWLVPQWPAPARVQAVCTTRMGGVSAPPYNQLNLGTHVGDAPDAVRTNRARLQQALGVRPVFLDQVHGTEVLSLSPEALDGGLADGAQTTQPGLACTVMVADCLPILLCDTAGHRVAAVHAGWRGLAGERGRGIVEHVYPSFMPLAPVKYAQGAMEVIAWLGPCIGPQAFEVGDEVREAFMQGHAQAAQCFVPSTAGKWYADLAALARQRLQAVGVRRVYGNDSTPAWCTVGNPLRFFSHRRDRVSGRQAACIWLRDDGV